MRPALRTLLIVLAVSIPRPAAAQTPSPDPKADWSKVAHIRDGREIGVRPDNARTRQVRVLAADDRGLTVLHSLDNSMPAAARQYIRELYRNWPEFFENPGDKSFEDRRRHVRVSTAGVVVDGQKVADWSEVVERIPRERVIEVTTRDPIGDGFLIGFLVPATIYAAGCIPLRCPGDVVPLLIANSTAWGLIGLVVDAINGGSSVLYARPDNHSTQITVGPIAGAGRKGAVLMLRF